MSRRVDLVIARYKEDISWLHRVPQHIFLYIYNKNQSNTIVPQKRFGRVVLAHDHAAPENLNVPERSVVCNIPNIGREADTYLEHIINHYDDLADITIFCQGDPFPHSPDFLDLLNHTRRYSTVQPLTDRYLDISGIPPKHILANCTQDHLCGSRVYVAPICFKNFAVIDYHDHGGYDVYENTAKHFKFDNGTNVLEWLMKINGFNIHTPVPSIGYFCYAAIFAVKKESILQHPKSAYINLKNMIASANPLFPSAMERMWLQLFYYDKPLSL